MNRLAPLLLIAVLAAGCGGHKQTKSERIAMEGEFSKLAMDIGNATMGSGPADEKYMEQFTHRYVHLTRKYAKDLGDKEVKKRLTDEVAQIQPWCLPCVNILYRERANY
jgi:hypothetical protein